MGLLEQPAGKAAAGETATGETSERTGESATEGTRSTEAPRTTRKTATHLVHQFVHFTHQSLHFAGHLPLLEASLEGVLGATLAGEAGAAEVTGECVAVGAEVAGLSERSESAGSTGLREGAIRACKSLSATGVGGCAESGAERESDADRSSGLLVLINFINSTHDKVLTFRMSYQDSIGL